MADMEIIHDDALEVLRSLPGGLARCCVTSPPYWSLRDYGVDGQLGLEATPEEYVEKRNARSVWTVATQPLEPW